jgi:hypothetical protein
MPDIAGERTKISSVGVFLIIIQFVLLPVLTWICLATVDHEKRISVNETLLKTIDSNIMDVKNRFEGLDITLHQMREDLAVLKNRGQGH